MTFCQSVTLVIDARNEEQTGLRPFCFQEFVFQLAKILRSEPAELGKFLERVFLVVHMVEVLELRPDANSSAAQLFVSGAMAASESMLDHFHTSDLQNTSMTPR